MLERVQLAVQLAASPLEEAMRSNLAAEDIARRAQVSPSHEPLALLGSLPRCGPASETTVPWARPPWQLWRDGGGASAPGALPPPAQRPGVRPGVPTSPPLPSGEREAHSECVGSSFSLTQSTITQGLSPYL